MKRNDNRNQNFWRCVQQQFESPDFINIVNVKDTLKLYPLEENNLIPFLIQPVNLTENLEVNTRFDLLSDVCKFNFITLISLLKIDIPDEFIQTDVLSRLILSYTQKPALFAPKETEIPTQINREIDIEKLPEIKSAPMTPEFFDEIESLINNYCTYAESICTENLSQSTVKIIHDTIQQFYGKDRSLESMHAFASFYIYPYISSLKSSANRLIIDALLSVAKKQPDILISDLMRPLFFSPESSVHQFQVLQRLLNEKSIKQSAVGDIFDGKPSSMEGPLSDEALRWLTTAIAKTPQMPPQQLANLLLHIQTQMKHGKKDANTALLRLIKSQVLDEKHVEIVESMLSELPDVYRTRAEEIIKSKTTL